MSPTSSRATSSGPSPSAWMPRNGGPPRPSRRSAPPASSASPSPESIGGAGIDLFTSGLVLQAFSRWNHALALSWVAHENLCLNNIYRNAQRGAAQEIPARPVQRRDDRRARPDRARRRLRCAGLDAHDRAARRRPLRAQRQQDLHHQRPGRRRAAGLCQDRQEKGAHGISAFIVEKDFPGFKVAQKLEKMGFRGSQTGGAGVRGLPRAGREPGRRAKTAASRS